MKALILAAGQGRRLRPFTSDTPKCLLELAPHMTILARQIRLLTAAGVDRVVVVAGYGLDQVLAETAGDPRVRVVYNPFYGVADNLISLWSARSEMDEDLLVVNGDNVYHPALPHRLMTSVAPACQLLVQRKPQYGDDDMKVCLDGMRLTRIGKQLPVHETDAESIGMMSFRGEGVEHLHSILEEAVQDDDALGRYYLDGIQRLARRGVPVHCLDIDPLPWADVDTPADLGRVRADLPRFGALPATQRSVGTA